MLTLKPILIDEDQTKPIYANDDCQSIFKSYPAYYYKTGYTLPWIGYWVYRNNIIVGVGGFTGQPVDGKVEIAYGTFKAFEGQGIGTVTCKKLIAIAKSESQNVIITAKTAPEENASTKILQRNGFEFTGIVQDEEIGDAWQWVYKEPIIKLAQTI